MNRIRVSDGGEEQAGSARRAGEDVIYVGRASFRTEHTSGRFQEMPESPWPKPEVARADEAAIPQAGNIVRAQAAPVASDASVILGINLSGPIVCKPEPDELPVRRDDGNGTLLPAGEVSSPRARRSARGFFPSTFAALMIVTVLAFSAGLLVSPLGDATASHRGVAPRTLSSQETVAGIGIPLAAEAAEAAEAARMAPLIVPTAVAVAPRVKAPAGRGATVSTNSERVLWAQAPKKYGAREHGAGRRRFATASVREPARAATKSESDTAVDDRLPSRKSADKESLDLTKHGAGSAGARHETAAAKPWVDPWAD